ncbi:unnamed protein product, partial [Symbiodinium microadriaticum]
PQRNGAEDSTPPAPNASDTSSEGRVMRHSSGMWQAAFSRFGFVDGLLGMG